MKNHFRFVLACILIQLLFMINVYCDPTDELANDKSSTKSHNINSKKKFLQYFAINKISNLKREFATIYINDNVVINSPDSKNKIEKYLADIKKNLNIQENNFATFKYGDMPAIKLKLPYLGIGRHGMVFEIIDEEQQTKKVLKLNIRKGMSSLKAGIKETYNYYFWKNIAKKYTFEIANMHNFHAYGLYSIKEKNSGVSLTKYLINEKIIFQNDKNKNKTNFRILSQQELDSSPIKEISQAILDLLDTVKNNRENCSSISPNNIFVEFESQTSLIKKIELIDYGISTHKIYNYLSINNFNQYIKLASKRLKVYIQNDYIL